MIRPPRLRGIGTVLGLALLAATPAWAEVAVPDALPQAVTYQHGRDVFFLLGNAYVIALAAVLLPTGWAARLGALAKRLGRGRLFRTAGLSAVFVTLVGVPVDFALSYGQGFWLAHLVGISNETIGHWWHDQLIALAINLAALMGLAWLPYWLLRRYPRTWPLRTALAMVPILVFVIALSPVLITPLFNTFTPMTDHALESSLRAEAARVGLGDAPILVMNQSESSKAPGAYVTGLFGSKRIVLYDTLLASFTPAEIRFVLGHEAKHYLLHDVWKLVGFISLMLFAGLWGADRLARFVIARLPARAGITDLADPASFVLLQACFAAVLLVLQPVMNLQVQRIEHEADRFGLELTQNNDAAANAFVKLQQEALGIPDPGLIQRIWRTDHPPLRDRILFSNQYHPWRDGTPLRYQSYITGSPADH